ncbi:translocation/assembly module TamB domain-containing protein [Oligella urethralis]|uniref:translocation/assembly module TamB domain-containing protein n=1 Tax=Oligella urethralis TaxID=90245 RepID=UPI0027BAED7D|nr:translocation/assembly module TamB domain-containing protein [Oligella urethralis]
MMSFFRFTWLRLIAAILILLFTALALLVGTQSGSRWLLNTVMAQINGRMLQIEGTIWSGIESKELEVVTPSLKVVAKDNALAVNWLSLLRARLEVEHLVSGDLSLELFPTGPKAEEEPADELSLPISIQVNRVSVGKFTMTDAQGKNLPVGLSNFDLQNLVLDDRGTKAELKRLTVTHPDVESELSGTVALDKLAYPWPMHVRLDTVNQGLHTQSPLCVNYLLGKTGDMRIQTRCQVDAMVQADGGLDDLALQIKANGVEQGLDLNLDAGLDIESTIPLTKAVIDLTVAKDMRLEADIHSVPLASSDVSAEADKKVPRRLEGTLKTDKFVLDLVQDGSRLDSAFDFAVDVDAHAKPQSLLFKGGIFRGSRWNSEALNGGINIDLDFSEVFPEPEITAWDKLSVNRADILLRLGTNRIETKGQFGRSETAHEGLQLDVDLQDLSQVTPTAAGRAAFKLNMLGSLSAHDMKAQLHYEPAVAAANSAAVPQEGLGKAPLDMHFDLKGQLSSAAGRYQWQADLDQLQASHAGFKLAQQDTLDLSFKQTADDFLLAIGAVDLALTMPGEHEAMVHHHRTTLSANSWASKGDFKNLTLANQLMQLVGLEPKLDARLAALEAQPLAALKAPERKAQQQALAQLRKTMAAQRGVQAINYDGEWDLKAQPEVTGTLNLQRQSGATILPLVHPLPLDFKQISINLAPAQNEEGAKQLVIKAAAEGEQSALTADLSLERGFAMALSQASIHVDSTDKASLTVDIDTTPDLSQHQVRQWLARIEASEFDLSAFSLGQLPQQSTLNLEGTVAATVLQGVQILRLQPDLKFKPGSRWNRQDLSGQIKAEVDLAGVFALPQQIALDKALATPKWYQLKLNHVDTVIDLAQSKIVLHGDVGQPESELKLSAEIPVLAQWWPQTPGQAQLDLTLRGDIEQHSLSINGLYDAFLSSDKKAQPLLLALEADGGVSFDSGQAQRWGLSLAQFNASYAGMALSNQQPVPLQFMLPTDKQQLSWRVGETELSLTYPDARQSQIYHQHSEGQASHWQTQGSLKHLIASMTLYEYLQAAADSLQHKKVLAPLAAVKPEDELVFDAEWHLKQEDQLSGSFQLQRQESSGLWPFPTPVPLDFDHLQLTIEDNPNEASADNQGFSAEGMHIVAQGAGPKSELDAQLYLHPASPFMLERAQLNLTLPDESELNAQVFTGSAGNYLEQTRLYGLLQTKGIPLEKVSYGAVPPGMINGDIHFNLLLKEDNTPLQAYVTGEFQPSSRWNRQPLQGKIDVGLYVQNERDFSVSKADIDLRLGKSRIVSAGAFGQTDDRLQLSIKAPSLSELWPDLPGAIDLDLRLDGSISDNHLSAKGRFSQGNFKEVGKAPIDFDVAAHGGWKVLADGYEGWSGVIERLDVAHAGFAINQPESISLSFIPQGANAKPEWDVGASTVQITLPGNHRISLEQGGSKGKDGKFDSKGAIRGLTLTPQLLEDVTDAFGITLGTDAEGKSLNHGIIVRGRQTPVTNPPVFDVEWDVDFDGALNGTAAILHRRGDFILPSDPPVALGLQTMDLRIRSRSQGGTRSLLTADLNLATHSKGHLKGNAQLHLDGFSPVFDNSTQAQIVGHMDDISWLTGLTGDLLELGGRVDVDVKANYRGGRWLTAGGVKAQDLRIVEVENGIRLLNGTLDLGLNGNNVVINRLYFPSVIRIVPKEWRTRQWIEENPPAQNGSLNITGQWNLQTSRGKVNVVLDHYPILQRTDRFAMMSGQVAVDAALPRIVVDGKVTADAGWVSVDIKGTAPTLDSDVIVVRKGEEAPVAKQSDLDLLLNFTVDLGPRFYVVGFGLDAGLVGAITIKQAQHELSAEGQFNTRGGAIEAYGQRLQIRRGRIAFQGDIANPVLDIEALRRNLEVEAGLRVVGNARNPKITLVSYPDVSEVEKLSWLIMGRGPDSSGGDLAMLLSVGTSLIGGDPESEPIYKQLGIDDIAIRKGDVGESGSLLPRRTVGDSTAYQGQDDIAEQFIKITKRLKEGIDLSIEQALSGSGTVARVSYTLIRNLTVDAKVGTVNGLEMVYRRFFRD